MAGVKYVDVDRLKLQFGGSWLDVHLIAFVNNLATGMGKKYDKTIEEIIDERRTK